MGDILFLSQRIPYPPDKGDKIRSYRALLHLGEQHRIHLGTFIDDPDDLRHIPLMESMCESTHIARLNPLVARTRSLGALLTGAPLSLPYFYDRSLDTWITRTLERNSIDAIFVFSSAMAQYVLNMKSGPRKILMDFVDVDSEKFRQYAAERGFPASLIYNRESRKLLAFDRRVAAHADASFFVSAAEADLFRSLAPEVSAKTHELSNGIDTEYFDPASVTASLADLPAYGSGPNLIFTGRMDYKPNVDAVSWFVARVLPGLLSQRPHARFIIAGAAPAPAVTALAANPAVHVTGRVDDMRPWLAHADLAVAPMAIGRGIQNKVLEAAAMARPVLTTPEGLEGIDLVPDEHLFVAKGPEAFLQAILDILDNPASQEIGLAARARLSHTYSWSARMALLDEFLPEGRRIRD